MQFKSLAFLALAFISSAIADNVIPNVIPKRIAPIRLGEFNKVNGLSCESVPSPGSISFHTGGRVMTGTFNTYGIFYGTWSTKQMGLLTNVLKNIGASPYYSILKTYGVTKPSTYKKSIQIKTYVFTKALNDTVLPNIVNYATKHGLPVDTNGLYYIFTDKNVQETGGFCTQYCGFHTGASIGGKTLLYAFVGNPQNCITSCGPCNPSVSPNGDTGVDAMASVLSHELVETASDPLGNAWFDGKGYENADKCAYTYGKTFTTSNGAIANVKLGGKNYLIQQNWSAKTQKCGLS